ncbi:MAG: hypothetical protein ACYDCC_05930 [Actinomycetota bacterium]
MSWIRYFALAGGLVIAMTTLASAIRVVVLPRAVPARISRRVFTFMRLLFKLRMSRIRDYKQRDRIMAQYGPMSLFGLLVTWLAMTVIGFTAAFWGVGQSLRSAFEASGSSIVTLGFGVHGDLPARSLAITEAALGLVILALLITYLPTIYVAFSRRELLVAGLEVAAGYPPSSVVMIERYHRIGLWERSTEKWREWQIWFSDIEETHTSFPALAFFRSQQPYHSWITAAGCILDTAAIAASTVEQPRDADAELMIRAGYVALRRIATFFRIPFNPSPNADDPISIDRSEFDEVVERLRRAGVPLRSDVDQAWRDFAGWRVNYDDVLVELCALVMAPLSSWSSDRLARAGRPMGPGDNYIVGARGRVKTLMASKTPAPSRKTNH